jgi:hypothetical protein
LENTFIEYHFFNELDNIKKFDNLDKYPEAARPLELYPTEFIECKINLLSDSDWERYTNLEMTLRGFLCSYDEKDMQHIRRMILYKIEFKLMQRDYGDWWQSLNSECVGVTREAADFIDSRSRQ